MTMISNGRQKYRPLFDVHPVTGASIEVFYVGGLATFGSSGAGWFWWQRRRGFAPDGPAHGPFATGYRAYCDALYPEARQEHHFGVRGCNEVATRNERKMIEKQPREFPELSQSVQ
jgi:hypothetical protein